jgi:hypothetical protein
MVSCGNVPTVDVYTCVCPCYVTDEFDCNISTLYLLFHKFQEQIIKTVTEIGVVLTRPYYMMS